MNGPCVTCGQPTRRHWAGMVVCYGCAGVRSAEVLARYDHEEGEK